MIVGLLKEPSYETRVSLLPEHVAVLKKMNLELIVESGAGEMASAMDEHYQQAGARIDNRSQVLANAEVIVAINPLQAADTNQAKGKVLIGLFQSLSNASMIAGYASQQCTVFSMDMLPRTTRAQSMDVLSSQANIAGYKAVLQAANLYPRYFPMFMTAAGSIAPAKMLILGAGVAGLQAIATGKRLGAVIEVFDTRPAVKEEVMSLGAKFVEVEGAADASKAGGYAVEQTEDFLQRQKEKIAERVSKADIIITTAQIPGKKAPVLITEPMIKAMRTGSVIIDLASSTGGNTECTQDEATVVCHGVKIVGSSRLAGTMPSDASKLYGKNILNFLQLIVNKEGQLYLNFEDELVKGTCVAHAGAITNDRVQSMVSSS
jgi:NAD(P) transhydrogenase subunit alpha